MRTTTGILVAAALLMAACTGKEPLNTCVLDLDCGDPALGWRCIEQECYQVAVDDDTAGGDATVENDTAGPDDPTDQTDPSDPTDQTITPDDLVTDESADEDTVVSDELTDEDAAVADDATVMDEDTVVADDATIVDEDTVVADDATVVDEDTAVADDATVVDEDTAVADDATIGDEDTVVADDATVVDEDTAVADDATIIDQDTVVPDVDNQTCGANDDCDGDGWTPAAGDCCDTTADCADPALVNPGAVEVEGDTIDNDCNGDTDETPELCSTAQKFSGTTATDLIKAMDICKTAANGSWGIVGTPTLTRNNGGAMTCTYSGDCLGLGVSGVLQSAVMEQFGTDASNIAIRGATMTSLSSGRARDANDPNGTTYDTFEYELSNTNPAPADFVAPYDGDLPETKPGCKIGTGANDSAMLTVQLKVPTNAHSFSFNFRFFSQEYETWTCRAFNDFFITMLYTSASGIPADKNISFDANGNYISVNTDQFFTVCEPKTGYTCPDGTAALAGTGYGEEYEFGKGGGTAWLSTSAPVIPGETITLKFVIWDTSDTQLDSLVLIDNFKWSAQGTGGGPVTFECWDLDQDTICDPEEELSGDSLCTERDC